MSQYKWPQIWGIWVFYPEFFSFLLALAIEWHWKVKVSLYIIHFLLQNKSFLYKSTTAVQGSGFHVRFLWKALSSERTVPSTTVLWKHNNFTNCPNRVMWNWDLVCLNISRVSWIALTLGLALCLYQNYEGDHGWVFTDNTFLKPNNIA